MKKPTDVNSQEESSQNNENKEGSFFEFIIHNDNFRKFEENIEMMLDKVETYIHSMVNGIKKLSLKIKCPEKLNNLLSKAKNMTSNFHEAFDHYSESVQEEVIDDIQAARMISLKSVSNKLSTMFTKIVEEQSSERIPDITFSSYFESPGEILEDVTRLPLYIHILSVIFCLSCSAIFHLFFVYSSKIQRILARLDYGGISLLVGGSTVSPVYYSLYCSQWNFLR